MRKQKFLSFSPTYKNKTSKHSTYIQLSSYHLSHGNIWYLFLSLNVSVCFPLSSMLYNNKHDALMRREYRFRYSTYNRHFDIFFSIEESYMNSMSLCFWFICIIWFLFCWYIQQKQQQKKSLILTYLSLVTNNKNIFSSQSFTMHGLISIIDIFMH